MTGKFFEKTYKYDVLEPGELFEKFKDKFSKAVLPSSWNDSNSWTRTMLGIFDEIGRELGYTPKREYLRLDQTWAIRLPGISSLVLALEYENTDSLEAILDDELQKLVDVKAFLKVLLFYPGVPIMMQEEEVGGEMQKEWSTFPEIQERIRSAKIKHPDEKYLVITPVYVRQSSVIEVSACFFDAEGKGEDLADFQVKYEGTD